MVTVKDVKADVVDVDTYKPKRKQEKPKHWVKGLTTAEKSLLSNGDWLNDEIVNASQQLLSAQFPYLGGPQSVILGRTLAFNIEPNEFVQILHTGRGHWVTMSTIGCTAGEVNVFDSLPPSPTTDLLNQIAAILCTPKKEIKVNYIDVLLQEGFSDCGVFAIAYATALAYGKQPGGCFLEQRVMRTHLTQCLQRQDISMFPVKKTR